MAPSEEFLVESSGEGEVNDDGIVNGQAAHYANQFEVVQTAIEQRLKQKHSRRWRKMSQTSNFSRTMYIHVHVVVK